jgi:hypothetical protein
MSRTGPCLCGDPECPRCGPLMRGAPAPRVPDTVGRSEPSVTYKWGVVTTVTDLLPSTWKAVAWFKTETDAKAFGMQHYRHFAVARLKRLEWKTQ